jgi:hypothetical protein
MSTPTAITTYNNASLTLIDLTVNGNSLFLLSKELGLSILNITDPTNVKQLGTYFSPGVYQNIELIGHNVFLTKNKNEIIAIDCFDPTNPQLLSNYTGDWESDYVDFTRENNYLLVLKTKGFDIIDATNINNMTKSGEYNNDKDIRFNAFSTQNNITYLASSSNSYYQNIYVIDFTNPQAPVQLVPKIRPWYFGNIASTILMIVAYYLAPATVAGLGIFFIVRSVRRQRDMYKDLEKVAIKKEKKKLHEREW